MKWLYRGFISALLMTVLTVPAGTVSASTGVYDTLLKRWPPSGWELVCFDVWSNRGPSCTYLPPKVAKKLPLPCKNCR